MAQIFDEKGNAIPVTVIEAGPCVVTQIKTIERDGYVAIQVGFGTKKDNKITKALKGHLKEKKCAFLREFKIGKDEKFEIGQEIKVDVFKVGDKIAVSGTSIGKGFAGTVKRHHFTRGPMTQGSKSHRLPGSIGAGTTPGRVYKGLRMSGRMGGKRITVRGLTIAQIDTEKNLLLVKGAVPGAGHKLLEIRG